MPNRFDSMEPVTSDEPSVETIQYMTCQTSYTLPQGPDNKFEVNPQKNNWGQMSSASVLSPKALFSPDVQLVLPQLQATDFCILCLSDLKHVSLIKTTALYTKKYTLPYPIL